jgi:hypothetical protein
VQMGRLKRRQKKQDWLQPDEEDPGFQLFTEQEVATMTSLICLHQHYVSIERYIYVCSNFLSFRAISCFINSHGLLPINPHYTVFAVLRYSLTFPNFGRAVEQVIRWCHEAAGRRALCVLTARWLHGNRHRAEIGLMHRSL